MEPVRPAAIGAEIALGGALLAPFVSSRIAGAGLVRAVPQDPGMRQDASLRPIQDGIGLAEDVWLLGALLLDRDRYTQIITAGRHLLTADEPVSIGGADAGPNPCEQVGMRSRIRSEIDIEGPLREQDRRRLLEIADRCPVHRTLSSEIAFETDEG